TIRHSHFVVATHLSDHLSRVSPSVTYVLVVLVLSLRAEFEVCWVTAQRIVTFVTYLLSFWNFSVEYLPHNSVRKFTLAINRDVATPITTAFVSCPLPADFWIIAVGVDKSEHIGWLVFSSHYSSFALGLGEQR